MYIFIHTHVCIYIFIFTAAKIAAARQSPRSSIFPPVWCFLKCLYVCMFIYIYLCISICVDMYIHVHIHIYVRIYVCIYIYIYRGNNGGDEAEAVQLDLPSGIGMFRRFSPLEVFVYESILLLLPRYTCIAHTMAI